jgi:hypothetical protein
MAWLKVDDGSWMEPWVVMAGNEAFGTWARLSSYCAQYLTDGLVPGEIAAMIDPSGELLERLEHAGKVQRRESGFIFLPDFLDTNPSRAQVEADREATRRRQAEWRRKRKGSDA